MSREVKTLENNISESEVAMNFVFQAAIPCLKEILYKRGNTLPLESKGESIKEIV